jgi:photosystem II stability/assembly factor-like uncharacterized protein
MTESVLLVGTRKGLWVGRSDSERQHWTWDPPQFLMQEIYATCIDSRGGGRRMLVGATSTHFGPGVFASDDGGRTWSEAVAAPVRFPEKLGASVERIWQIQPGTEPGVVYAGTEPSALFRSADGGRSFELVRSLWDHPHRTDWGAGFGGQAIHTIVPHPTDADTLTVAMSTGGVYRTVDGGSSWDPANKGIKAYFFPDPWPEFGQCVHKVASHPAAPDRMFAQNHHGVYRTDDAGSSWVSIADGLPSDFGFPIVVHPHRPETVFVFPLTADGERIPPQAQARVWRSDDAGATWSPSQAGLPDGFYAAVLRDAMTVDAGDPAGLYLGARDGTVYVSTDDAESFTQIAAHLPDVTSVRAAVY